MKSKLKIGGMLLATSMLVPAGAAFAQEEDTTGSSTESFSRPNIELSDEIVVRGTRIPDPQRATAQVATFLGAEDLKRTGDDNAALALTRLSGLSIVGGKFAYVRGLGDRYSSARLNGSPLPSPEPLKRTVPLDLFPSNILKGATVQKTYSANYPGEFGGGIIDLETIRVPDDSFLNLKLGIGANLVTTAKDGLFVRGGDLDWLGYDDGIRSVPGPLQAVFDSGVALADLDPLVQEAVGESLVNSPLSVIQEGSLGPNYEGSIDGGALFDVGDGLTFGLTGVLGYKQDWSRREAVRDLASEDTVGVSSTQESTALDVTVNGLLSGSLEWDGNSVALTGLYIHSTTKEAQIQQGYDFNADGAGGFVSEANIFLERALWMAQGTGEHTFGEQFAANWRGAFARSTRNSPYERSLDLRSAPIDADDNIIGPPSIVFNTRHNINFSELTDDSLSGGVDLFWFVPVGDAQEATLSVGYDYLDNDREFLSNPLVFTLNTALPADVAQARIDFAYSPDNIDPNRFRLIDTNVQGVNSYNGLMTIHGAYAQFDAELIPTLRTTFGVRYETSEQSVDVFDRLSNPDAFDTSIDADYWLPSATVTWNVADDLLLRAGYSHTVARPQFRELAASQFRDPDTDRTYFGNPFLTNSEFRNYDARAEYYLGRNQYVAVAGFYKKIDNPIEEFQFSPSQFQFGATFINSPQAALYGGEFEFRTNFTMPGEGFWTIPEWLFAVNYTFTESEISAGPGDVIIERTGVVSPGDSFGLDGSPLVGTPKHIVNTQFGWESETTQFTLLLGWVDERLLARGENLNKANRLLDVFEKPGVQLDAVFRQTVTIHGAPTTFSISGRNLLATRHIERQYGVTDTQRAPDGFVDFNTYDRGRSLSASVSVEF